MMTDYLQLDAHSFLPPDVPHSDARDSDARQDTITDPTSDPLRRQVLGIISDVLDDSDPDGADARSHLRHCLAHNAGSPEKALLEHLLSLHGSELHGEPGDPQD
ncbi:hypothetical protein [Arthrobacter sp. ISL-65]|uniref:hypothetical protein n=1 Tax=Arthrobacter sp. ISL-65 TaxID=2819112 RepID=UPI001BE63010|nr:hypothetical protein [Arthrobacter sp. ISL-65]MBT2547630.1 hypothetical protein [Arthrobacter sp. ISL-65]